MTNRWASALVTTLALMLLTLAVISAPSRTVTPVVTDADPVATAAPHAQRLWAGGGWSQEPLTLTDITPGKIGEYPNEAIEEALTRFAQAVKDEPTDATAHGSLGQVMIRLGRHEEAVRHLERAIALQPDDPIFHLSLGVALEAMEHRHDATVALARYLQLDPGGARAPAVRARMAQLLESSDRAAAGL